LGLAEVPAEVSTGMVVYFPLESLPYLTPAAEVGAEDLTGWDLSGGVAGAEPVFMYFPVFGSLM
jgi:hypothetical protein